jgi:acylphosphatase
MVVEGRVQGVGFRYAMADEAATLGLSGWVRNLANGTVEACAWGPAAAVERLVAWAHQGPRGAHVTKVTIYDVDAPAPASASFEVRPTA